jgi:alpha-tubulin suppressor-like RCC1 family protein
MNNYKLLKMIQNKRIAKRTRFGPILLLFASMILVLFQNCGSSYSTKQATQGTSSAESNGDNSDSPTAPPTTPPVTTPGGGLMCTMPNQHLENGMCVSNTRSCMIANGTGTQTWSANVWGSCVIASCNTGYTLSNNVCQPQQPGFKMVDAGDKHTCAIDSMDRLWCMGQNNRGEVGNGNTTFQPRMIQITALPSVKQVSCGMSTTCAIDSTNNLWCWGSNHNGVIGINSTASFLTTPQRVGGSQKFKSVSVGTYQVCAIDETNRPWCWGFNGHGQLGNGTTTNSSVPTLVMGLTQVKEIFAKQNKGWFDQATGDTNNHTCAIDMNSNLWCWGPNSRNELAPGGGNRTVPVQQNIFSQLQMFDFTTERIGLSVNNVLIIKNDYLNSQASENLTSATQITGGYGHECYLGTQGRAFCRGNNNRGQIGRGSDYIQNWLEVPTIRFRSVTADYFRTCGIDTLGAIYCWGDGPLDASYTELNYNPVKLMDPI